MPLFLFPYHSYKPLCSQLFKLENRIFHDPTFFLTPLATLSFRFAVYTLKCIFNVFIFFSLPPSSAFKAIIISQLECCNNFLLCLPTSTLDGQQAVLEKKKKFKVSLYNQSAKNNLQKCFGILRIISKFLTLIYGIFLNFITAFLLQIYLMSLYH